MAETEVPELFIDSPLHELILPFERQALSILAVKDPWSSLAFNPGDPQHDVYWGEVWPAAVTLAEAILCKEISIPGGEDAVLDIGCGTGLVTVAAAIAAGPGTRILAGDRELRALDLTMENARRNEVSERVSVEQIDWAKEYPRRHRLIFAADCLYHANGGWPLAHFIARALDPDPAAQGRAIVVDPDRWTARNFKFLAQEAGFNVRTYTRAIPFLAAQGPIREVPVLDLHRDIRKTIEANFYELTFA